MNLSLCLRVQRYNLFSKLPNLFSKNFYSFHFFTRHFCGCKGTTFFSIDQIFFQKFFSLFFWTSLPFWKRVQNYNFFPNYQNFFQKKFSSILMNLLPSRKRVQKYNNFSNWPNISRKFFELFFKWLKISFPLTFKKRVLSEKWTHWQISKLTN